MCERGQSSETEPFLAVQLGILLSLFGLFGSHAVVVVVELGRLVPHALKLVVGACVVDGPDVLAQSLVALAVLLDALLDLALFDAHVAVAVLGHFLGRCGARDAADLVAVLDAVFELGDGLLLQVALASQASQHLSDDLDVGGAAAVFGRNQVDDAQDVPLHHAHKLDVVFLGGEVAQGLEKVHDVCAVVHVVAFELLEDAAVQVFVHFAVLEGVVGGLLGRGGGGIEVLELAAEAHADFEGVGHGGFGLGGTRGLALVFELLGKGDATVLERLCSVEVEGRDDARARGRVGVGETGGGRRRRWKRRLFLAASEGIKTIHLVIVLSRVDPRLRAYRRLNFAAGDGSSFGGVKAESESNQLCYLSSFRTLDFLFLSVDQLRIRQACPHTHLQLETRPHNTMPSDNGLTLTVVGCGMLDELLEL